MGSSCARGGLDWLVGKLASPKELSSIATVCPGMWLSDHPWIYLKDLEMWCLGTWFSGGLGSVRLMVGLSDLKVLFQPKWFYDSMIYRACSTSSSVSVVLVSRKHDNSTFTQQFYLYVLCAWSHNFSAVHIQAFHNCIKYYK